MGKPGSHSKAGREPVTCHVGPPRTRLGLGSVNSRRALCHTSEVTASAGVASSKASPLGLQVALVFLRLHITFPPGVPVSRFPLFVRTRVISDWGPP